MQKKTKTKGTTRTQHTRKATRAIDFAPALTAIGDLAAWVFDQAQADVKGWPEGKRRVRAARRLVLARLRGEEVTWVPTDDLMFTAGVLMRIGERALPHVAARLGDSAALYEQLVQVAASAAMPGSRPAAAPVPFPQGPFPIIAQGAPVTGRSCFHLRTI